MEELRARDAFRREQADFEGLFRRHYAEIVRFLAPRTSSHEEASDLAAEVFLEAWRRVPGLRWRGRPVLAWLYRVAANMAADRMRERAREAPLAPAPAVPDPAAALADRDALTRALGRLTPEQALAVHLRLVEGYSFAAAARLMGRSTAATQMLVLRAGRRLRELLEEEGLRGGG